MTMIWTSTGPYRQTSYASEADLEKAILGDTNGLTENAVTERRVQGVGGGEVHPTTQEFAQPPL